MVFTIGITLCFNSSIAISSDDVAFFGISMNTGAPRRDIVASELPYPFSVLDNSFQRMRQQIPGSLGGVGLTEGDNNGLFVAVSPTG